MGPWVAANALWRTVTAAGSAFGVGRSALARDRSSRLEEASVPTKTHGCTPSPTNGGVQQNQRPPVTSLSPGEQFQAHSSGSLLLVAGPLAVVMGGGTSEVGYSFHACCCGHCPGATKQAWGDWWRRQDKPHPWTRKYPHALCPSGKVRPEASPRSACH